MKYASMDLRAVQGEQEVGERMILRWKMSKSEVIDRNFTAFAVASDFDLSTLFLGHPFQHHLISPSTADYMYNNHLVMLSKPFPTVSLTG